MLERRNSVRISLSNIWVREENGDYLFSYQARDLSEEGMFLEKRLVSPSQEPFSKFSLSLPGGIILRNLNGRIVREERRKGAAVQFLNLSEEARLLMKKFLLDQALRTSA